MSRGILDTSVLIATDVAPIPGELAISVASLAELQFGVLVASDDRIRGLRLGRLSAIQRRFDALPIDEAVADSYAQLAARVVQVGRQPRGRVMDLLIAATAHAHNAAVYTRNPNDLIGLDDLITITAV
ncbi:MAG TPA: PIN domain-containing protein [Pseudonocardiaceae bacterium]